MAVRHFRIVLEGTTTNPNLDEDDLLDPKKDVFAVFSKDKNVVIHNYLWFLVFVQRIMIHQPFSNMIS